MSADSTSTYSTLLINVGVPVLTALLTYWATKKKNDAEARKEEATAASSQFAEIIKANSEFREEVRRDLLQAKAELDLAKARISLLEKELAARDARIAELEETIASLKK